MADVKKEPSKDKSLLQTLEEVDEKLSQSLSLASTKESRLGYLRPHMKLLELSCHGLFWISGCIICLWFTGDAVKEAFFFNLLVALVLDILMVAVMKASIRRSRPSANLHEDMFLTWSVDKLSCPSGHTSRAVLMCLLLMAASPHLYLLHPVLIFWSISTCLSRVLLGRHYLGDVLVGAALGYVEYLVMSLLWADPSTASWYLSIFGESDSAAIVDDL